MLERGNTTETKWSQALPSFGLGPSLERRWLAPGRSVHFADPLRDDLARHACWPRIMSRAERAEALRSTDVGSRAR